MSVNSTGADSKGLNSKSGESRSVGVLAEALQAPAKITVKTLDSSRYAPSSSVEGQSAERPSLWDSRKSGIDVVTTTSDLKIKLQSDGQQSPPREGWVLMLTGGDAAAGFTWTLYGMPHGVSHSAY